tara:strand:+ start:367 stop:948 length:582 start_codon:yes stop_codon:yes gene_type:complete
MLNTQIGSQVLISNYAKKGVVRGRGDQKATYGNDVVNLTIEVASYTSLMNEELTALKNADLQLILDVCGQRAYTCWDGRGKKATERPLTMQDLDQGLTSLISKREKAIANDEKSETYTYLSQGVKQHNDTGATFIQGILVDEQVVTKAPNGSAPRSKSGGKTVAEKVIARILNLRSRKWRQYDLTKGEVTLIK